MSCVKQRLSWFCFGCYCVALFYILFLRNDYSYLDFSRYPYWQQVLDKVNPVPFSTIAEQLRSIAGHGSYTRLVALRNLAANLLLFVPMGIYLPLLWEKLRRLAACVRLWIALILSIEIVQLLTLQGSFDIDDVILNSLGFLGGFCVFSILNLCYREER